MIKDLEQPYRSVDCRHSLNYSDEIKRGKCDACVLIDRTCTACNKLVDPHLVYVAPYIGRGHQSCLNQRNIKT